MSCLPLTLAVVVGLAQHLLILPKVCAQQKLAALPCHAVQGRQEVGSFWAAEVAHCMVCGQGGRQGGARQGGRRGAGREAGDQLCPAPPHHRPTTGAARRKA